MVIKRRADGQIKTCRIHDTLHEFCKSEAARKNLFLVMDREERIDENTCSARRLCFHSFTTADISDDQNKSSRFFLNWDDQMRSLSSPFGKHIHSLFLSSPQESDEVPLTRDELAAIPNIFPLLRVLNIESIKFNDGSLPNEVYRLYLLKYIAISGSNLNLLPKSFKKLVELETLVIKTTARALEIEGGIWNMEKLRHVRTNTSAQLPFPLETNSKTNSGGKHIHTLSTISPASCIKEIFSKTPNLRKLGVRGNLSQLLEEKENICLFNNLQMLKCLVNLKLYGEYDKVLTVPMLNKFARRLKKLSFSGTLFEWKDMAVLGSLEELEVLKLDDYAFKGENWELSNNVVFRRLQYLRIGRTNLVTWKATENSFPALQSLILRNCNVIERIPEAFAKVHTLKVMELFHVSESATQSVKEVRENIKNNGFKLIITSHQKREGAMTAGRDTLIELGVRWEINYLVDYAARDLHLENGGLVWEMKILISDIETFNARLEEAYENPTESVNVLIMKNFQTIVKEALDAVDHGMTAYFNHKDNHIRKFLVPRYRREVKFRERAIQSIRTKVNTIDHEHKKELEILCNYEKNAPLVLQKSTMYDRAIEAIEQEVNMVHQKIEDNVNWACDIMSEIMDMMTTFTEYLVKACKNPKANKHRVLKVIVKKFQIVVNETMNTVSKYFAQEKKHGNNALAKSLDKIAHCGKPNAYASEIQSIKEKVKRISEDHTKDLLHLSENYYELRDMRLPKAENNIVGFIDDLETIKSRIMEASKEYFVIPIVGNAGAGKTTFALKIFEDPEVRKIFTHCIWLHVSRGFHRKQNFIDILHQISKQTEDFSAALLEDETDVLEAKVKGLLEDERYLIVLDDVREKEDWDFLKVAFPTNMKGSRVLVTTWSGNTVDSTCKSHSLKKLSNNDGWLLIKNNVFDTEGGCDTLIEELGIKIAEKCKGLPHALVLVAGILRNCITFAGWQQVADNPLLKVYGEDQSYHKLVYLSYDDLPDEMLKKCFLYFAYFPMGYEIVAWKLICLWISEGFIPTTDKWGPLDKEVEASKYLNVLVNRNLVMVKKRSADGQIKTCCIHNTLHEFCRREVEGENFFHDEGQRLNARIDSSWRLCSYYTMGIFDHVENNSPSDSFSNLFNKRMGSPHQVGDKLDSLLVFSSQKSEIHSQKSEIHWKPEDLKTILKTFPNLKVLNIESPKFSSLPNELYSEYSCIRYLAIRADISSLPKSFEHLSCLETLVIKTTERSLQINGGIWNMEELRHVHTNTSTQLHSPPKTGKHDSKQTNIRTLSTISPGSCTNKIFNKTPKLKKLGVRGNLSQLLQKKKNVCLFNNLQMLECLENLKLHGNSEKVKLKVPMSDKFPRRLRKLTLSGTLFQWNDMTVLGLLGRLKVLKLDENAFSGEHWNLSSDVIFKGLQYLRIGKMNLITWTAVDSEKSFPVLETLVLRNSISLQNIPQDFANVDNLKVIELFDVSETVADFARQICVKRHGKTNVKINGFITPLSSQATVHNLAYENGYVNTSRFDYPSTSIKSQEIEHNQSIWG
ncbi:PREDICTED: putative late blight resistance protein homolog R1B-8 [Ipomoea nil]|uniref:putative late blight resistance protein homolog R1B-8 n=1 Tax=Ipomoea nil TaxID=35883 RepID=UPI0009012594|nr:PREDICTED: putative late blight resistance protein homolog R1B-8 [Ipomoea nil]